MEKIQKYSKNGEIEILSVMGFEKLRIKEKKTIFLLTETLPTELYMLTTFKTTPAFSITYLYSM